MKVRELRTTIPRLIAPVSKPQASSILSLSALLWSNANKFQPKLYLPNSQRPRRLPTKKFSGFGDSWKTKIVLMLWHRPEKAGQKILKTLSLGKLQTTQIGLRGTHKAQRSYFTTIYISLKHYYAFITAKRLTLATGGPCHQLGAEARHSQLPLTHRDETR